MAEAPPASDGHPPPARRQRAHRTPRVEPLDQILTKIALGLEDFGRSGRHLDGLNYVVIVELCPLRAKRPEETTTGQPPFYDVGERDIVVELTDTSPPEPKAPTPDPGLLMKFYSQVAHR